MKTGDAELIVADPSPPGLLLEGGSSGHFFSRVTCDMYMFFLFLRREGEVNFFVCVAWEKDIFLIAGKSLSQSRCQDVSRVTPPTHCAIDTHMAHSSENEASLLEGGSSGHLFFSCDM